MGAGFLKGIPRSFIEGLTKFMGIISVDHAYVHDGIAFAAIIETGSISAPYRIGFTTPAASTGKYIHWRPIGMQTSADYIKVKVYEGDASTGGTAVTPFNRNRPLSAQASGITTMAKGVTATPAGVNIQADGVGTAGTAANKAGGGVGAESEIVLKAETAYVVEVTPAGATDVTLTLAWYEETGYQG